jgi:TolA-binding protein
MPRQMRGLNMRIHLLGLILMASAAAPAAAQRGEPIDRRVDRLEQQVRAVQRRVFPDGNARLVEPEIGTQAGPAAGGNLSGDALANLNARVDAIEAQLRGLTGQIEEAGNRSRQAEQEVARLRADLDARLDRLEAAPARPADPPPAITPARRQPAAAEPAAMPAATVVAPSTPGTAEDAYNAGFRLWNERRFGEAQATLEDAAARFPTGRWISWIRNLQGRAYLDDNKPATAARILLANYQENPRGERAADSLYYLGQSLTRLNRRAEACRVYDELAQVYPQMRGEIRRRIPQARTDARCESGAN